MAFGTSNVVRESSGSGNILRGSWTGVVGDAAGTITGGGAVLSAMAQTNNSTGPENAIPCRMSNSGNSWTVTIPYQATVTSGTFEIKFK